MQNKAQSAIEYLLLVGVVLLVAAIVIIAMTSITSTGIGQNQSSSEAQGIVITDLKQIKANSEGNDLILKGQIVTFLNNGGDTNLQILLPTYNCSSGQTITIIRERIQTTYPCPTSITIQADDIIIIKNTEKDITIPQNPPNLLKLVRTQNQIIPTNGILNKKLLRADGSEITTQSQLEEAYTNGEIVLQYKEKNVSLLQYDDSEKITLTTTGCYGNYYFYGALTFTNNEQNYENKYAKIISVNNDPLFPSLIGKKLKTRTNNYSNCHFNHCGAFANPSHINFGGGIFYPYALYDDLPLLRTNCQMTYGTNGIVNPGPKGNGWQVNIYDYNNIVLGLNAEEGQIAIDTNTGTIFGITLEETAYKTFSCEEKFCTENPEDYTWCTNDPRCNTSCNDFTCTDTQNCNFYDGFPQDKYKSCLTKTRESYQTNPYTISYWAWQ